MSTLVEYRSLDETLYRDGKEQGAAPMQTDVDKSRFLDGPDGLLGKVRSGIVACNKLSPEDFK